MSSFFSKFPKIPYSFEIGGEVKQTTNLSIGIALRKYFVENASFFDTAQVPDGMEPRIIADRVYGSQDLDWLICLTNHVGDMFFDWPLSTSEVDNQLSSIYNGPAIVFYYNGWSDNPPALVDGDVINDKLSPNTIFTVREFDPILGIVFLYPSDELPSKDRIYEISKNDVQYEAAAKRIVQYSQFALHHFEDEYGNLLDPLEGILVTGTNQQLEQSPRVQITYDSNGNETGYTLTGNTTLQELYANSAEGNLSNIRVITIDEEYRKKNSALRKIVVVKPDFVQVVIDDLNRILRGIET